MKADGTGGGAQERIVFPLDVDTSAAAADLARSLKGRVGMFKIGLELFVSAGPDIISSVTATAGRDIFLDLKFHDIPATVHSAAAAAARCGVRFISVHAAGGSAVLRAAVEGAGEETGVLAITALTSLGPDELREIGCREDLTDPEALVLHRAGLARGAGCAGIVCSGMEIGAVRERFGRDLILVVPGIRPAWSAVRNDDQRRMATPAEAIGRGADYLVIGRPIRQAADPAAAAERTAAEIAGALS